MAQNVSFLQEVKISSLAEKIKTGLTSIPQDVDPVGQSSTFSLRQLGALLSLSP